MQLRRCKKSLLSVGGLICIVAITDDDKLNTLGFPYLFCSCYYCWYKLVMCICANSFLLNTGFSSV